MLQASIAVNVSVPAITDLVAQPLGIHSPNAQRNYAFYNWNQVDVWYCTSDSFLGELLEAQLWRYCSPVLHRRAAEVLQTQAERSYTTIGNRGFVSVATVIPLMGNIQTMICSSPSVARVTLRRGSPVVCKSVLRGPDGLDGHISSGTQSFTYNTQLVLCLQVTSRRGSPAARSSGRSGAAAWWPHSRTSCWLSKVRICTSLLHLNSQFCLRPVILAAYSLKDAVRRCVLAWRLRSRTSCRRRKLRLAASTEVLLQ